MLGPAYSKSIKDTFPENRPKELVQANWIEYMYNTCTCTGTIHAHVISLRVLVLNENRLTIVKLVYSSRLGTVICGRGG